MAEADINGFESESEDSFDGFNGDDTAQTMDLDTIGSDISVSDVSSQESSESEDECEDSAPMVEPIWTKEASEFVAPNIGVFTESTGPTLPGHIDVYNSSSLDYFQLFMSDEVFQEFAVNTNSYAKHCQDIKRIRNPDYKDKQWCETNPQEMKAYVALNILFGLSPSRRIRHYWSTNAFLRNEGVSRVMSQRRFTKLTEYFHISDRSQEPPRGSEGYDSLYKIRNFMERLQVLFPMMSKPTKEQTIDEGLQPFQGRDKKVQYLPDKPKKRGFKMWIRCDSLSGYVQQFEVYTGKRTQDVRKASDNGPIFDVVDRLTKPIQDKFHHVYFDNYYTSIPLLLYLLGKNTYACGTIQSRRKCVPSPVKEMKKLGPRGEIVMCQDTLEPNLTVCGWRDTKTVRFASTQANPNLTVIAHRRSGSHYVSVYQPHAAQLYGRFMGGVDIFDHLRERYRVGRYGKKAWKYLFFFLVDAALVNSYILYRETSKKVPLNFDQFQFRLDIIPLLIKGFTNRRVTCGLKPAVIGPGTAAPNHANKRLVGRGRQCAAHRQRHPDKPRHTTVYGCELCGLYLCKQCHLWMHSTF